MEWFREKKAGIFVHYINFIFMLIVIDVCYEIKEFNYLYITLLYTVLMVIYWFYTGFLHKGIHRFILIVITLIAMVFFAVILKDNIIQFINVDIVNNAEAINNLLLDGKATYFYQFKPIITLFLPILVFILLFFYDNKITEGVLLLSLTEMIFFWYLEYFKEIKMLILPFVLIAIITYMINNYKKTILEFQKKGIYTSINGRRLVINILIFSLIAAAVGMGLPQEIKGKNDISLLDMLEKKYSEPKGTVSIDAAKTGIYGLEYSGYTNTEKKLGGPIKLDTGTAFKVETDKARYLKGDTKDEYTGYSWKKTTDELRKLESGDDAIRRIRDSVPGTALFLDSDLKKMKIYPEKLKSTSFMVPLYTSKITEFDGDVLFSDESSTFAAVSKISKAYSLEFYDVDYKELSEDFYTVYYAHSDKYQKYLQLPNVITERTVDLVYDLVKDCKNNEEKVVKLRDYLSKNYTYTLNASILPANKDFVDYFLFEDKKGYCVHFATALSVMYRIAGIPARYVEGFKMNETSKKGNLYNVTNDTAHAWVEYLATDNIWAISDCSPTALEENIRIEEEKKKEQTQNPTPQATLKPNGPGAKDIDDGGEEVDNKEENKGIKVLFSGKLVYIEVSVLAAVILGIWIAVKAKRKRKMLRSDSVIPMYNYIVKRLRRYKQQKGESETEKEFASRRDAELKEILLPLIGKVYDEFYGGMVDQSINKKDIYIKFEQYLKKQEKWYWYYLKKL